MLEKKKRRKDYYSINSIIKDVKENMRLADPENPTAKEVLTYMIGDSEGWVNGEYRVYKYTDSDGRTLIQRINLLWFFPLFILSIPFQYLITGDWGINRNTKIGRAVEWLVGFE